MSSQDEAPRCAEMTRTENGWEMCHRSEHAPDEPHHVTGRAWYSGRQLPGLRFTGCGEACVWPRYVLPYLGSSPRLLTGGPQRAAVLVRWAK